MKLLVCGTRDISDYEVVRDAIEDSKWNPDTIIHGGADGVDSKAGVYADNNRIETEVHPIPDWVWATLGAKAGPMRNGHMVGEADAVVAVWDGESSGTENAIQQAMGDGIPVYKVLCTETEEDGWTAYRSHYEDGDQSSLGEFCQ